MTTWVLLFYFGWGLYGPNSYTVIGHYKSESVCKEMGHRVALAAKESERYYCVEEIK